MGVVDGEVSTASNNQLSPKTHPHPLPSRRPTRPPARGRARSLEWNGKPPGRCRVFLSFNCTPHEQAAAGIIITIIIRRPKKFRRTLRRNFFRRTFRERAGFVLPQRGSRWRQRCRGWWWWWTGGTGTAKDDHGGNGRRNDRLRTPGGEDFVHVLPGSSRHDEVLDDVRQHR